jgi:hypothetical protein
MASASGLAAATRREREEMLIIIIPLKPAVERRHQASGVQDPSPDDQQYQSFAEAKRLWRLYIRIQPG